MANFEQTKHSFGAMQALLNAALELAQHNAANHDYKALLNASKQVITADQWRLLRYQNDQLTLIASSEAMPAQQLQVDVRKQALWQHVLQQTRAQRCGAAPEDDAFSKQLLTANHHLICPLLLEQQVWGLVIFAADGAETFQHLNPWAIDTFCKLLAQHCATLARDQQQAAAPATTHRKNKNKNTLNKDGWFLPELPMSEAVDEFQRQMVRRELERHDNNWAEAARHLGLDRSNMHRLGRRIGLKPSRQKNPAPS